MNEKIIKRHFCETDLQKLKIKKEKLASINTLELGEAITIFNTKIKVIENCLKKQNYYEAREKLEELANGAFYEKFRNVFRFNQGLYEKLSLKRKEKAKERKAKRYALLREAKEAKRKQKIKTGLKVRKMKEAW